MSKNLRLNFTLIFFVLTTGIFCSSFSVYAESEMIKKNIQAGLIVHLLSPSNYIVDKYKKIEFGAILHSSIQNEITNYFDGISPSINPYDPDKISIEASFQSPQGKTKVVYGFYYRDFIRNRGEDKWTLNINNNYEWRIRFAPDEVGEWTCDLIVKINNVEQYSYSGVKFNCIDQGAKGYLEVGKYNRQLRYSETWESFFAIGQNIPWPEENNKRNPSIPSTTEVTGTEFDNNLNDFISLAENGGNYVRVMMINHAYNPEMTVLNDYTDRQPHLWELDKLFDLAETNGIYIHFSLESFSLYQNKTCWGEENWFDNPYKKQLGLTNIQEFFSSQVAKDFYKRRLRYIVSRWGYSSHLACYELFNEIDMITHCDKNQNTFGTDRLLYDAVSYWHIEMAKFIKHLDKNHLITTSYAGTPYFKDNDGALNNPTDIFNYNDIDFTTRHDYNSGKDININRFKQSVTNQFISNKPVIFGETGLTGVEINNSYYSYDDCDDLDFHNTLWSSAFMGTYGTSLYWPQWYNNTYREKNFPALKKFFENVNFEADKFEPVYFDDWNESNAKENWEHRKHRFLSFNGLFYNKQKPDNDDGKYEFFFLQNSTPSDKAMAWIHNRSVFGENAIDVVSCARIDLTESVEEESQKVLLKNMKPGKYNVEWYSTRGDGELIKVTKESTFSNGSVHNLRIKIPFKSDLNNPDFAVKIKHKQYDEIFFQLFPNPSDGLIELKNSFKLTVEKVEIYNTVGMKVFMYNMREDSDIKLNLESFPRGLYTLKVFYKDEHAEVHKLVIR